VKKPDINSQNDSTSGLKRLGGDASDAANRVPADLGSRTIDKINQEQSTLDPDPVTLAGGGMGEGRQFTDSNPVYRKYKE
jgi:hypothetical protein